MKKFIITEQQLNTLLNEGSSNEALKNKSEQSGISYTILKKVYDKGMAAWNSGHRPGVTQQQWAMGRVNSFITGKGGSRKADADLWKKAKKSKQNESININRMILSEGVNDISDNLKYHIDNKLSLTETVFRYGSSSFMNLINEVRKIYEQGIIDLSPFDIEIIKTDIGKTGIYEGEEVFLDLPQVNEILNEAEYKGKTVELNKPKRGGSKKFYVYTKNDKGNVIKVSFGAKAGGGNLSVKLKDPEAKKSFAARHNCPQKNDKTKPGYWACRLPRYAKQLGLSGGGKWW
jgi:hypothetical protein